MIYKANSAGFYYAKLNFLHYIHTTSRI